MNLEFWQEGDTIFVDIDGRKHTLAEFIALPDGAFIVGKMYQVIIMDHCQDIEEEVDDLSNKGEVVGRFICRFFLKQDQVFDVVYLEGGNRVRFNLETD
jgi:hypothetical protein